MITTATVTATPGLQVGSSKAVPQLAKALSELDVLPSAVNGLITAYLDPNLPPGAVFEALWSEGPPDQLSVQVHTVTQYQGRRAVRFVRNQRQGLTLGKELCEFGLSDFTVSLWFCTNQLAPNSELFSNRADGSHGNFFNIRYARGHILTELDENYDGLNYIALNCARELNDDKWHHVLVRRQGRDADLFVDGKLEQSGKSGAPTNIRGNAVTMLGASVIANAYDLYFPGYVTDLLVYRRWLDDHEVARLASQS
eukprot:g50020.t1